MELVFIDESGSLLPSYDAYLHRYDRQRALARAGKGPWPRYPYFLIAAVSIPESHFTVVADWIRDAKRSFLGSPGLGSGPEFEIKGSILYALRAGAVPFEWQQMGHPRPYTASQQKVWGKLSAAQLLQLEDRMFSLFRRFKPVIWGVVVKQADIYDRHGSHTWSPLAWSLTYLQQRVVQHLMSDHGSYQHALFIMDETSMLSTALQFDVFMRTRDGINARAAWPIDFRRHMVDLPLPSKSHLMEPLQLADLVAHAIRRHVEGADSLGWFARIEPLLPLHWSTGSSLNAGLTFIPG